MSLTLSVQQLNHLVQQRRLVEGIERFYSDDIVMVEGGGATTVGKDTNRERERVFESGLTRWDARLVASAVDEAAGTALNQWTIEYAHSEWGAGALNQVAVQQWRDGRIVHEAFYKI